MPKKIAQDSILQHVCYSGLNDAIRREMRNREVYTPPISTFRWWARRSHRLMGQLIEAAEKVQENGRLVIADPFAGGGTTVLEALRRGHVAYGQDINPWAAMGMEATLDLSNIGLEDFDQAFEDLSEVMSPMVEKAYATERGWTSHVFRVARVCCLECGTPVWLYPYAMLSMVSRSTTEEIAWFGCQRCGSITKGPKSTGVQCSTCGQALRPEVVYLPRRKLTCPSCSYSTSISSLLEKQRLQHNIVLVERVCEGRRWMDLPIKSDILASDNWPEVPLPHGEIPIGKETSVLLRHGFGQWRDLYPLRQRAVLTRLLEAVNELPVAENVRHVLQVAAIGTAEMAGLSSRWDRYHLKAYESVANHRFSFVPFTVEPNVWGNETSGRGTFLRRVKQMRRSINWFSAQGELGPSATIVNGPSQSMPLGDKTVDLVLTDPPYFGDVQYGELSSVFLSWINGLSGIRPEEVVVDGREKGRLSYTDLLTKVLQEVKRVLRPEGRLVLTYHNRTSSAFSSLAEALAVAGFVVLTWRWVASENERDFSKRMKRACTMDLVLECLASPCSFYTPGEPERNNIEAHFLWTAGAEVARAVNKGNRDAIEPLLCRHPFLVRREHGSVHPL